MAAPGATSRSHPPPAVAPVLAAARRGCAAGRAVLALWRQRSRYRRDLRRLIRSGPHLIEDIGLLPRHAEREADKPFWRL